MIRLVLFLIVLAVLAFAGAWIADRPGEISIVWQGWNIQTTVPVALAALAVLTGAMMLVWRTLSLLLRSPRLISAFSLRRRKEKGWNAVTRGLLAIGTGDAAGARAARAEAARLLPHEPLTHLLSAQTAQFEGNKELAIAHFRAMANKPSTRLLGLRGLHMEARRAGELAAAAAFAEEAASSAPTLGWAAEAVIEARCADGDFAGARAVLERQMAQKGIDKAQYRRRRAVLLAAEAIMLEHGDPLVARERAVEAVRLAPTLVPAAACAGRLLGAAGELRKAAKIVETAYAANPHPELAEVEAFLRPGDAAQDRLKRIRNLAAKAPSHRESAIALARTAIDAHEFAQARLVLEPLLEEPSQRVCLLMAELEAAEHADIGKAREWTARAVRATRDPAWIADGVVSDHWAPISPVSGKLDAFVWAVPPGVSSTPILEHEAERVKAAIAAVRASEEAKAAALAAAAKPVADAVKEADTVPPSSRGPDDGVGAEHPVGGASKAGASAPAEPLVAKTTSTAAQGAEPALAGKESGAGAKDGPVQSDPVPSDAARPAGAKAGAAMADPAKPGLARPDVAKADAAEAGMGTPGAAEPDAARPETAKSDTGKSDTGKPAAGKSAVGKSEPGTSQPKGAGVPEAAPARAAAEGSDDRVVQLPPPQKTAAKSPGVPGAGASSAASLRGDAPAQSAEAQAATAPASARSASEPAAAAKASAAQPSAPRLEAVSPPAVGAEDGAAAGASAPPVANDRRRPSRVEPIVAMPPLPDDPGPGPDEPEEPQPPGRRPRFLEL